MLRLNQVVFQQIL